MPKEIRLTKITMGTPCQKAGKSAANSDAWNCPEATSSCGGSTSRHGNNPADSGDTIAHLTVLDTGTGATATATQPGDPTSLLLAADNSHAYLTSGTTTGDGATYLTTVDIPGGTSTTTTAPGRPRSTTVVGVGPAVR